jgi:hypothetical protein
LGPRADGRPVIPLRVGNVDVVAGVRYHTGEVLSVYLMDADVEKLTEFLCQKHD